MTIDFLFQLVAAISANASNGSEIIPQISDIAFVFLETLPTHFGASSFIKNIRNLYNNVVFKKTTPNNKYLR